ncbi:hypothetical protein SAMN04487949_1424 [Halogranum gelatinilyticum]|uniref:SipW-cognate class signal peptide n=1 Tax=Halogranum gelatinilyticum TaxID=660521 RepID=A0A1G9SMH6_9EURY|nr:hypothetical protein [Halogranum gelatinilyticum]SDM36668.1 hypothetical protein SAMN04487949_1424 [Halogranum gelatinilyticum]
MTQPQFRVTRRKILAGLGTIGVASAGAGLGTTAFFGDAESLNGWLQAGRVDLKVDYRTTYTPWLMADEVDARGSEFFRANQSRSVYPVAGDPMSLHIGSVPALDETEAVTDTGFTVTDGESPSHAAWKDATLAANACDEDGEDYIGERLVDGDTEVFVDLMDIKPYDEGETTFSLHLCGNPVVVSMRADVLGTPENGLIDPEDGSGDETDDNGSPTGMAGELQNYLWVEAWADDCDNLLNGDETPFYQGSLAGFFDLVGDDYPIPFDGIDGAVGGGSQHGNADSDDATLPAGTFEDFAVNTNIDCTDLDANLVELLKIEEEQDLRGGNDVYEFPVSANGVDYTLTVTVTQRDGAQATKLDWTIASDDSSDPALGIEAVLLKDGRPQDNDGNGVYDGGVRAYYYEEATSATGLTVPDDPATATLKGISNVRFCYDVGDDTGGNGGGGTQETGVCVRGTKCWAFRWYLPCMDDDTQNLGFSDLPSDAATADLDGDGELTLADELIAAGLVERDGSGQPVLDDGHQVPLGANVIQTDGVHFTLGFQAVQCRHNPDAM